MTINTTQVFDLNGTSTTFPVNFEYLLRKFVEVTLLGDSRTPLTLVTDFVFDNATTVRTLRAWGPSDGFSRIEVRRVTSAVERVVNFNDATILRAGDLNTSELQSMHIAEEARNSIADVLGLDSSGNLDAEFRRIVNLAKPINGGDAVDFGTYLEDRDGVYQAQLVASQAAASAEASAAAAGGAVSGFISEIASPSGSTLVGDSADGSPNHATTQREINSRVVHVLDHLTPEQRMMAYLGVDFDAAPAVQAAIDRACPPAGSSRRAGVVVSDPRFALVVRTAIDATNSRQPGTLSRDGLRLVDFNLLGETGSGRCVIETTGSQWLEFSGDIRSGSTNRSTVGILQAISAILPQTQNQKIHARIFMHSDSAANGGGGTVGIWNFGAEENTYDTCYVQANLPALFTAYRISPNYSSAIPPSFQEPLLDAHSCGVNTGMGEQFWVSTGRFRPSLVTEDVNSFHFPSVYMSNIGEGGGNLNAWWQFGGFVGGSLGGTIEQHCGIYVTGAIIGAKIGITFGGLRDANAPRIVQDRFSQGQFIDSEVTFQDTEYPNRQLFSAPPVSPNEQISCFLQNTTFKCAADKQYLNIPENMLWNPKTGNVTVEGLQEGGLPYRYVIDGYRKAHVGIPPKIIRADGVTGAVVVRFVLPTIVNNANALAATITVEGLATIRGAGTGAMSMRTIKASISVLVGNTGAIATGATTVLEGSQLDNHPAGNSITALALTASAQGDYVALILSPTVTGANMEDVTFTGSATMTWSGNESRAPSLQLP